MSALIDFTKLTNLHTFFCFLSHITCSTNVFQSGCGCKQQATFQQPRYVDPVPEKRVRSSGVLGHNQNQTYRIAIGTKNLRVVMVRFRFAFNMKTCPRPSAPKTRMSHNRCPLKSWFPFGFRKNANQNVNPKHHGKHSPAGRQPASPNRHPTVMHRCAVRW